MDMTTEKTIGFILLGIGLVVIAAAMYMAFNVFTGSSVPPEISKIEELTIATAAADNSSGIKIGPAKLVLNKEFNKIVDMGLWCMFTMFLVVAGSRISSMGIQMLREIKFEVKGE